MYQTNVCWTRFMKCNINAQLFNKGHPKPKSNDNVVFIILLWPFKDINIFFKRFSRYNIRWAPIVYWLIDAMLIGNFWWSLHYFRIKISAKRYFFFFVSMVLDRLTRQNICKNRIAIRFKALWFITRVNQDHKLTE